MPFPVRDLDLTPILAATSRKIDAETSGAGITVDLPMKRAGLRSARREDVEALFALQLAPQLEGQRKKSSVAGCTCPPRKALPNSAAKEGTPPELVA